MDRQTITAASPFIYCPSTLKTILFVRRGIGKKSVVIPRAVMAVSAMAAIAVPKTPRALTVLGVEYQVVRQLGTGSYAQVFEVVRLHDGERLAAKCIDQGPLSTWARKQLVCEVEIQQSLQHPHILRMHAAGEDAATGKFVCLQVPDQITSEEPRCI